MGDSAPPRGFAPPAGHDRLALFIFSLERHASSDPPSLGSEPGSEKSVETLSTFTQYLLDNLPAAGAVLMGGVVLVILVGVGLIVRSIIPKD